MAEVIALVDDLDRTTTEGVETVTLSLAGKIREVDLSPEHREELEKFLEPYLEKGRTVTGSSAARTGSGPRRVTGPNDAADIRWWANETDDGQALLKQLKIERVQDRGQIHKEVRSGWEDAGKPRKS